MLTHGRLPWPKPSELPHDGESLYNSIARGPRALGPQYFRLTNEDGCLEGPFNSMVLAPSVGSALQSLGTAIRFQTGLSARAREIAILSVAVALRSEFEWYAHEQIARAAGVNDEQLRGILEGNGLESLNWDDAIIAGLASSLALRLEISEHDYKQAQHILGTTCLIELVTLVGYYMLLDLTMSTFQTPLPDGVPSRFTGARNDE